MFCCSAVSSKTDQAIATLHSHISRIHKTLNTDPGPLPLALQDREITLYSLGILPSFRLMHYLSHHGLVDPFRRPYMAGR